MTVFCDLISSLKKMLEKERLQERMFFFEIFFPGNKCPWESFLNTCEVLYDKDPLWNLSAACWRLPWESCHLCSNTENPVKDTRAYAENLPGASGTQERLSELGGLHHHKQDS